MNKVIIITLLFILSSCQSNKIDSFYAIKYDLDHLLLGLTLEKTTIKEIQERFKIKNEKISKFGKWKHLLIASSSDVLAVSNEGILRAVTTYELMDEWDIAALALKYNFTPIKPNYWHLKTFAAEDDIIIELSSRAIGTDKKLLVIEVSSKKFRDERIELYKIEARKGVKLYQEILSNIGVPY